ncbi:Ubiquinone/menaquinone biosynthesis C-methylase UbiE [Paraburkholderia lycopersici]|uniref:Ubiquinone/menaquinone biosynthesis C-methylase UbiE n=2 Tax=Paraburkholderia lycopersici TaxID=416944 RepID=A0A1G6NG30_9BURK|nr:Ubiquinone/menaquinone biosynthesis C-methylase UbiE [Paraburkholderia lycopersici]
MDKAEFDSFADEYRALHARNIAASGENPEFFAEYKIRDIAGHLERVGAHARQLLDFGAGVGNSVPWVRKHMPDASLTCVDVSEKSLQVASDRFPGLANYVPFDGERLPFTDDSFDLAFAMCVFHHIPFSEHVRLLQELARTLRHDGALVIYEHNPLNPLTVKAVNDCEFDVNAKLITARQLRQTCLDAGFRRVEIRYRIFFPHALAALRRFEKYLIGVPFGAQYAIYAYRQ